MDQVALSRCMKLQVSLRKIPSFSALAYHTFLHTCLPNTSMPSTNIASHTHLLLDCTEQEQHCLLESHNRHLTITSLRQKAFLELHWAPPMPRFPWERSITPRCIAKTWRSVPRQFSTPLCRELCDATTNSTRCQTPLLGKLWQGRGGTDAASRIHVYCLQGLF